jgi:hypothetical protein
MILYSVCYRMYGLSFFNYNSKSPAFYMLFVLGTLSESQHSVCYRMYGLSIFNLILKAQSFTCISYSACYRMCGSFFFILTLKAQSLHDFQVVLGMLNLYVWLIFFYFNSKSPIFYMHFVLGMLPYVWLIFLF